MLLLSSCPGEESMRNRAGVRCFEKDRAGLGLMHPRYEHVDDSAWRGDGMKFHDPKIAIQRHRGMSGCSNVCQDDLE